MKNITSTLLLLLTLTLGFSQQKNIEFTKKNFPGKTEEFKSAHNEFKKGNHFFHIGFRQFKNALKHYEKAYQFNPNNAILNYRMGICYISTIHKIKSVEYFENAYYLDPKVSEDIMFELAEAHHINEDFDLAITWYSKYKMFAMGNKKYSDAHIKSVELQCDKKIEECEFGKEFVKNPINVEIKNIGDALNTEYSEFGPVITADESIMLFTSKRPGSTGFTDHIDKEKDHLEPDFHEDIYITSRSKEGIWSNPKNMGHPINTIGHDATVYLSPDGQKMILYNSDEGGTLYTSELDGTTWSRPHKFDSHINSLHHETSATFSLDQKTIYFVSNRPEENQGGLDIFNADGHYTHDIYYSTWDEEKEKWSEAKNMGAKINTQFNERAVFMHPDGKTLYFSSEGHNSMGGYDIFKTEQNEKGEWGTPENLGYPVNGPDNDVYFVLNATGTRGYYSSRHSSGFGEKDLYVINFLDVRTKDTSIVSDISQTVIRTTIIKGRIIDNKSSKPIAAKIIITDNSTQKIIYNVNSNSASGNFLVSLPTGKNYGIAIEAENYLFHSENFDVIDGATDTEIEKEIRLNKVAIGESIILNNIFFDLDKATLKEESITELNRLESILKDNPTIRVEISGHTDSQGSQEYNMNLSEKRAKSVVEYLINKGIDKDRLEFKGYGEKKLLSQENTKKAHAINRRTGFIILSK